MANNFLILVIPVLSGRNTINETLESVKPYLRSFDQIVLSFNEKSNFIKWDHRHYLEHAWTSTDMHRSFCNQISSNVIIGNTLNMHGHQRTCIDQIDRFSIKFHQMGSSAIPRTRMDIDQIDRFQSNFIKWDHRQCLGHKKNPCHFSAAIPWTSKGHQWTSSNDDDDDVDDDDDGFDYVDDDDDGFDDIVDDDDGFDDIDDDDDGFDDVDDDDDG